MPSRVSVFQETHRGGNVQAVGPFDGHAAVRTGEVALVRPGEGEIIGPKGARAPADGPAFAAADWQDGRDRRDMAKTPVQDDYNDCTLIRACSVSEGRASLAYAAGSVPARQRCRPPCKEDSTPRRPEIVYDKEITLASVRQTVRQSAECRFRGPGAVAAMKEAGSITPMSWNARRASIVLLALLVAVSAVWLDEGHAQVKEKARRGRKRRRSAPAFRAARSGGADAGLDPDGFLNNGIHLVKDEKGRGKQIEAAIDYINDEELGLGRRTLAETTGNRRGRFRSAQTQERRGPRDLRLGQRQAGSRSAHRHAAGGRHGFLQGHLRRQVPRSLLKKAKKNGDPSLLNDMMKQFAAHRRRRRSHQTAGRLQIRSRRIHARSVVLQQAHQSPGRREGADDPSGQSGMGRASVVPPLRRSKEHRSPPAMSSAKKSCGGCCAAEPTRCSSANRQCRSKICKNTSPSSIERTSSRMRQTLRSIAPRQPQQPADRRSRLS